MNTKQDRFLLPSNDYLKGKLGKGNLYITIYLVNAYQQADIDLMC